MSDTPKATAMAETSVRGAGVRFRTTANSQEPATSGARLQFVALVSIVSPVSTPRRPNLNVRRRSSRTIARATTTVARKIPRASLETRTALIRNSGCAAIARPIQVAARRERTRHASTPSTTHTDAAASRQIHQPQSRD